MTLQPGDIILKYTRWSLSAFFIRGIQHCRWSHAILVVNDTMTIEALGGGVTWTPLRNFDLDDKNRFKVVRLKKGFVNEGQLSEALKFAMSYVGREYDWTTIFRLAWAWAWKLRRAPIDNDRHRLICSEVVAMPLWRAAGFRFRAEIPAENTSPKDIAVSDKVEAL